MTYFFPSDPVTVSLQTPSSFSYSSFLSTIAHEMVLKAAKSLGVNPNCLREIVASTSLEDFSISFLVAAYKDQLAALREATLVENVVMIAAYQRLQMTKWNRSCKPENSWKGV